MIEQVRSIKTYVVTELASGQTRKYSGIAQATASSALSFQVSGNVQTVSVNLGDRVTEGQVLAQLDGKPYELDVQAAEAELRRAQATLDQKKLDYDRQKTLCEKGRVMAMWLGASETGLVEIRISSRTPRCSPKRPRS